MDSNSMQRSTSRTSNPKGRASRNSNTNRLRKQRGASEHSSKTSAQRQWKANSSEYLRDRTHSEKDQNSAFLKFSQEVICPFCMKIQEDKISLVKHLNDNCRIKSKKSLPFTKFQILSNNAIKCNVCFLVTLNTIVDYFSHAIEYHQKQAREPEFLYCSCCFKLVPSNYTELEFHIKHKIHNIRRKSALNKNYFFSNGIQCIYGFYSEKKKFICLNCRPPNFLFNSPFEVMHHFRTSEHIRNQRKGLLSLRVFCCFCDEEVNETESPFHFTSEEHMEKAKGLTGVGGYELCLYCGFICKTLRALLTHMRSNCEEIIKIRKTDGIECETPAKNCEYKIKKERCIVVKDDIDVKELTKILQAFGKVTYTGPYDDHKIVIEFKKAETIEFIVLIRSFIKVKGKKVDIYFLSEAEG